MDMKTVLLCDIFFSIKELGENVLCNVAYKQKR